jgi:hypothetical protein
MHKTSFLAALICSCPALLFLLGAAGAETDAGRASADPWSGYWWQHKSGGLTGPLAQYDQVTGGQAAQWERDTHVSPDVPDWYGHCHAWAASSVSEQEPPKRRNVRQVRFGVGDQKGLLAACHAQDISNSYGDRFGDGEGGEDRGDIAPDELWRLLQMYVKQQKIPLILDLEAGEQVWNYPVYQYRVDYQAGRGGWYNGKMELVAADNNVSPDFVGTQPSLYAYTFRFKMADGGVLAGSGQWTGDSVEDHPDFAWYPYVAVAENPEVDVDEVSKIVGYAVGGDNTPPADEDEEPADDVTPPDDAPPPEDTEDVEPAPPVQTDGVLSVDELLGLVVNKTSTFALDIFVDKGDGGRYRPGEPIRVSWRSGRAGYLYLFDIDSEGAITLVFPLQNQPNEIRGDALYDLPGKDEKSWFLALGPGQHDVKGIVTTRPVRITGFAELAPPKPQAEEGTRTGKKAAPRAEQISKKPQKLVVHPTAARRFQGRLVQVFRKGSAAEQAAPEKIGPFAQDMCSYFVLPGIGKQGSGTQGGR